MSTVFISYGHRDMEQDDWQARLGLYLAQSQRDGGVSAWSDSQIAPGTPWRDEIAAALDRAAAGVLLVGPAFLASAFIAEEELPKLLGAGPEATRVPVFPLVVRYCAYTGSPLAAYQAFNDPNQPLEALATAEQNRILNDLSQAVDRAVRDAEATPAPPRSDLRAVVRRIRTLLDDTQTAFRAQAQVRNTLVAALERRLGTLEPLEYELLFQRYHPELVPAEQLLFDRIRATTEGSLHDGNREIFSLLESSPQLLDELPRLADLRRHLTFWLNKFEHVFVRRPDMCVLYTGVEDGVPFPVGVENDLDDWLARNA